MPCGELKSGQRGSSARWKTGNRPFPNLGLNLNLNLNLNLPALFSIPALNLILSLLIRLPFLYLWHMLEVSVAIIFRNNLILACQRKRSAKYPLQWEFPGGKIEPGETPAEALARELKEELGIVAVPGLEYHRQEWDYGDTAYRVFYYRVDRFEGEPANLAFEEIRWVTPQELAAMEVLAGNREVVQKLQTLTPYIPPPASTNPQRQAGLSPRMGEGEARNDTPLPSGERGRG